MATARRRLLWLLLVPVVLAAGLFLLRGRGEATQFTTGTIDRGDVVEVVGATGTLEAVTTVQIGLPGLRHHQETFTPTSTRR